MHKSGRGVQDINYIISSFQISLQLFVVLQSSVRHILPAFSTSSCTRADTQLIRSPLDVCHRGVESLRRPRRCLLDATPIPQVHRHLLPLREPAGKPGVCSCLPDELVKSPDSSLSQGADRTRRHDLLDRCLIAVTHPEGVPL